MEALQLHRTFYNYTKQKLSSLILNNNQQQNSKDVHLFCMNFKFKYNDLEGDF